jgi:hypothetical protein
MLMVNAVTFSTNFNTLSHIHTVIPLKPLVRTRLASFTNSSRVTCPNGSFIMSATISVVLQYWRTFYLSNMAFFVKW